jgi:hypothetical protein
MHIREYAPEDEAALRGMHARQEFEYPFPDLSSELFLTRLVLEDDAGRPVMAMLGRVTCEVYLLAEPGAGTPRERWRCLVGLHEAARHALHARGFDDATCWVPPRIERAFGRRLRRLGWVRDPWPSYSRSVKE